MKRVLLGLLGVVVVFLVVAQLYRPERTNPQSDPSLAVQAKLSVGTEEARILNAACNDCHSNQTQWPWYSQVAPISWLLVYDVNTGREALNFSEWGRYPPDKQAKLLKESCEEVREGQMPPGYYIPLHGAARLSAADKDRLCAWTQAGLSSMGAPAVGGSGEEHESESH